MSRLREALAALSAFLLVLSPAVWGAPSTVLGTVIAAERAHVGISDASVGATVFSGDQLSTEAAGNLQVRAGGARFLLSASSSASLAMTEGQPSARLLSGTAVFSTASAKAFALYASKAEIRPQTDAPTVAQVSIVSARELTVRSSRGPLLISVEGETQVVADGAAYRVILDPTPEELAVANTQGPGIGGHGPLKAGKSKFLLITLIVTGVVTFFVVDEIFESPSDP